MNFVTIAGHLGADPEVRFTSTGQKVTTFRVAARARRGSKDETIWWRVTVWGEQFDKMIPYFKKGSPIFVIGELSKPEIFTDSQGHSQVSMNITAFNLSFSPFGKPDRPQSQDTPHGSHSKEHGQGKDEKEGKDGKEEMEFSDEEIPF